MKRVLGMQYKPNRAEEYSRVKIEIGIGLVGDIYGRTSKKYAS